MKHELNTEIDIEAPAERVWARLSDFGAYPAWNPLLRSIRGQLAVERQLEVELSSSGSRTMTIKPRVVSLVDGRSFAWRGRLIVPGLFDGEHHFVVEPIDAQRTRFRHFERFSGVLVPLFKRMLDTNVRARFVAMNEALKEQVERQS